MSHLKFQNSKQSKLIDDEFNYWTQLESLILSALARVNSNRILDGVKNIVFEGHAELFKTWIVVN